MTEQHPATEHQPMTPERYAAAAASIESEVAKLIVGQAGLVRQVLICLLAEGHALLEGVPGLGKTMLLRTLSQAVDLEFSRIQFTPDLMPADIVGTQVLREDDTGRRRFEFSQGPLFANLVLADEVNRATPKTQSALLEAMQERSATVAGQTRMLPRPFFVMATQNPIEMEGTYPLPEAQLDRFLLKILVELPEPADMVKILERTTASYEPAVTKVVNAARLRAMITLTRQVPLASHLARYAASLVAATHPGRPEAPDMVRRYVRFGASPRGAQSLVLAAKVTALLGGELNVSEEGLRAVALPALRHRIILSYEALADGISADSVIDAILAHVPSPAKELEGLG
ncbi:MAG TPA: AAA family ATPase [Actinomycetota bacterium]|nr:AAA family ATPase [Actinomycetota bacterium]